jgi:hypothetical protein
MINGEEESIMIRQQIIEDMKTAMKAHDTLRLGVLRFMLSEIKNREIDAKHELVDEEVITLLRTEVKRRNEAIAQFKQGNRLDLADQEEKELVVINAFLPAQMDATAVEAIVEKVIATTDAKDFGQVMKLVMQALKGQADGKLVSELVRAKLH